MLKIATLADFDTVKQMALKFMEVSGYKEWSDEETIDNVILDLLSRDKTEAIVLLHGDKGVLAGAVSRFPFGKGYIASEVAWWVEPDARKSGVGKELLEAFEFWAKEKTPATIITMVSLDDKVGEMYLRAGYKLRERAYMKDL